MIKFIQGQITTKEGISKDVVVKAATPNTLKDMLIGGGITLIGITYLTVTAFRKGADAFDVAKLRTLHDLGLLSNDESNVDLHYYHF